LGSEDSSAQTVPQAVRPLEQVWQAPLMQAAPEAHWPAPEPEQVVRQAVLPHRNGLQPLVVPPGQFPCPSQNEAAALMLVVALQVGPPHITVEAGITQLAWVPLQLP
jgi:hypothetical protein